jgi:hypothetical protein
MSFSPARPKASVDLESNLQSAFASIAGLLVTSGYSHSRASALLKLAFINAAADFDRSVGKRANIARIAASTGLTRLEVSTLLRSQEANHGTPRSPNRAMRVAEGWSTDSQFKDAAGRPRQLKLTGARRSFSALAKRYSGDIPARAVLREMQRLGLAAQDEKGAISLLRTAARIPRKTVMAMRAISPWVDSLWRAARIDDGADLRSSTHQLELGFDSLPQVFATFREFDVRTNAFIRSIAELGANRVKNGKHEIRISIAVAATRPTLGGHGKVPKTRRKL